MVYPYCLECRGTRNLCKRDGCELLESVRARIPPVRPAGRIIQGPSPPDVFVGHIGYPGVRVGPLVPPGAVEGADPLPIDGASLAELSVEEVVAARSQLYHTRQVSPVRTRRATPRLLDLAREVAMSAVPVDTEVELSRPPPAASRVSLDPFAAPRGPGVDAERGRVVGSASVPRRVDQLVSDVDATADTAARELVAAGVGSEHVTRLFTLGLLGRPANRRLVPTRWSITAVDDIVSRGIAGRVRTLQELGETQLFSSTLHGNRFFVILLPRPWAFEMLEAWVQGAMWAARTTVLVDREGHEGRASYARSITGAYYAARLAVLEHLESVSRQADAVVYREVTEDYWAPLGVWVIREGVRRAVRSRPEPMADARAAIEAIGQRVRVQDWWGRSEHLDDAMHQARLSDFRD